MKIQSIFLAMVVGTTSPIGSAQASDELSQSAIRELVKSGEILSLEQLLGKSALFKDGHLLDLEVETEHGVIIYELEFLMGNGHVNSYAVDARTGEILDQQEDD